MAEIEQSPGSKGSSGWFPVSAMLLPLLYVLSIGPVVAIAERTKSTESLKLLKAVYAPVIWLHDHTILKKPLEAYVELWGVK
jgi:hypothetical protein